MDSLYVCKWGDLLLCMQVILKMRVPMLFGVVTCSRSWISPIIAYEHSQIASRI